MRLLSTKTLQLTEFVGEIPYYAILSHRWEDEEVLFEDIRTPPEYGRKMKGYRKIEGCINQAKMDGWEWVWIDSCCIDKSSSAELSEAINSMFRWYRDAQVCYTYLSDVLWEAGFMKSKWWSRGWTLQELLAPETVIFYDYKWRDLGTKYSLKPIIEQITGIGDITNFEGASVAQKLSWASHRKTTRIEDMAYSLMGIFRINMPLLYGEGKKAFLRLQVEIINKMGDESIFAW
ncbi:heterokaryon incompatibility protein-domain-containing protein, partial [Bisporella sp. PMI_857]